MKKCKDSHLSYRVAHCNQFPFKRYSMKKIALSAKAVTLCFLSCLFFFGLAATAQKPAISKPEYIEDANLGKVQSLLQDWQYTVFYDESGEPWEQHTRVDEKGQMIYYQLRPFRENNTEDEWWVSHHIPVLCIDTVTMNYDDSTISFLTAGDKIGAFQGGFKVGKNKKISLHMQLPKVRNLAGQLQLYIQAYRQQNQKIIPATARQIVATAVYDYIDQRIFNTAEVKKLLSNQQLYIGKCMICGGTQDGFRNYTEQKNITADVTNQTYDLRISLFGGKPEEQLAALETLVEEAISDFYENYNFSKADISSMKAMLTAERKKSMGIAGGKKCASCDGACKKTE